MRDRFGRRIRRGTVITYPLRQGSSMWMNEAVVEDVDDNSNTLKVSVATEDWSGKRKFFRRATLRALDRVTVLPHVDSEDFIESWSK